MEQINENEIVKAIERSGYLLENRILSKFMKRSFWSEANHAVFFKGDETKYREIDVIASKLIDSLSINEQESCSFFVHFIVECINNPQPLGLFENLADRDEPSSDWIYDILNGEEETREVLSLILPNIIYDFELESEGNLPSKQYCSFIKKKGDHKNDLWMAYHPDDFHKTLLKLAESVKYKVKEIQDRWTGIRPLMGRLDFFIPLIILQNDMIKILQKGEEKIEIEIYRPKFHRLKTPYDESYNRNLSIDIVQEMYFDDYLDFKLNGLQKMFGQLKDKIKNYG